MRFAIGFLIVYLTIGLVWTAEGLYQQYRYPIYDSNQRGVVCISEREVLVSVGLNHSSNEIGPLPAGVTCTKRVIPLSDTLLMIASRFIGWGPLILVNVGYHSE